MSTMAENKQNKRKKILESAFSLFINKSVNSTAIDEVVKAAGVAKGTFYLYFKDKTDLLNQLLISKSASVIMSVFNSIPNISELPLEELITSLMNKIIDYLNENREFTALLQKNLSYCFRELMDQGSAQLRVIMELLAEKLIERGYTRDNARKTLYIIIDLTGSVCCDAIIMGKPYGVDEIRPFLINTVVGILEKGASNDD